MAAVLVVVACFASYLPARRAARIDPLVAAVTSEVPASRRGVPGQVRADSQPASGNLPSCKLHLLGLSTSGAFGLDEPTNSFLPSVKVTMLPFARFAPSLA